MSPMLRPAESLRGSSASDASMMTGDPTRPTGRPTRLLPAIVAAAVRPRAAARELLAAPDALRTGLRGFAVLAAMYTFTVFWGWRNGFGAAVEPWVPIPAEDYYFWEMFFAAPVYAVVLVVYAGVAQLVLRALGGVGRFEDLVALLGLSMVLPTFVLMWAPETVLMVGLPHLRANALGGFAGLAWWPDVARQVTVPIWMLGSGALAVAESHRVGPARALLGLLVGLAPAVLLAVTWIR